MTVSDDLNAAADVLERDGWVQGSFHTSDGAHCAVGAIEAGTGLYSRNGICGTDPETIERLDAAIVAFREATGIELIPDWNDADGRTAEEVIQAMRDAAIKNQPDSMWG